jgi:hypothetical protein
VPQFQPAESYPAPVEPEPVSENVAAVTAIAAARAAAQAEMVELQARLKRLEALKVAVPPLEAELAALNASESAAMAEWSADPSKAPPTPDIAARDEIMARLTTARQLVSGADAATISVSHAHTKAAERANALAQQIPVAVAMALIDEAHALLPEIAEAGARFGNLLNRFSSLKDFILTRIEAGPKGPEREAAHRAHFELITASDAVRNNAPKIDGGAIAEWRELAASLGDVATAPSQNQFATAFALPASDPWINGSSSSLGIRE